MPSDSHSELTILIPVLNEYSRIVPCLDSIWKQDYPSERFEVIIADGGSSDGTQQLIRDTYPDRPNLRIIDNPKRTQAAAFNLGIAHSTAPYLMRMDAHCIYAPSYVRLILQHLKEDEHRGNVGGAWDFAPGADTYIGNAICIFNQCRFGIGGATFRVGGKAGEVDTVPFGAFPRKVIDLIGGMNEILFRGEDNEYNARIHSKGYTVFFDPQIRCTYYCRSNLKACLQQMYANGLSIGLLMRYAPYGIGLRHMVPAAFMLSLFLGIALLFVPFGWIFLTMDLLAYFTVGLIASFLAARKFGLQYLGVLPFIFFTNHIAYGAGTIIGLFRYFLFS